MSEIPAIVFGRSPFVRWTLLPVAILALLSIALSGGGGRDDALATGVTLFVELILVLLIVALAMPKSAHWAGRAVCGMVFLAYVTYLVVELIEDPQSLWPTARRSTSCAFNAAMGLLVIGTPALIYALTPRRQNTQVYPNHDSRAVDSD